jgi:hypothetical protein
VTIAAGFRCNDGIIICSDTLETVGDYGKRKQSKIVVKPSVCPTPPIPMPRRKSDPPLPPPPVRPECIAVFAGAGEADFLDKLTDSIWLHINQSGLSFDARVGALEDAAIEFHQKYWPVYPPDQRPEVHLVVALWTSDKYGLFKVIGPIVNEVITYESVGYGISLSKYICDRFYRKSMSMRDARIISVYMLEEVKEHVQWCGGDSHVLSLSASGYTDYLTDFDVEWGKNRFARFDKSLGRSWLPLATAQHRAKSSFSTCVCLSQECER